MNYGALTRTDIRILERVLGEYAGRDLCFLEIGVHSGTTARGIWDFCHHNDIKLEYWGVDDLTLHKGLTEPFPGANLVIGKSSETFHLVPSALDVVFVDGAHSRNDVILDTFNYAPKVVSGGFILFHDTSPEIQHSMREAYGPDIPQFYNAVNEALNLMKWPLPGWRVFAEDWERGEKFGGMTVFQRAKDPLYL